MTDKERTIEKLVTFRKRDKFSDVAWEKRGLNPSSSEMCLRLQHLFNDCAGNLIEAVKAEHTPGQLKRILENSLKSISGSDYDTEEREFICDYYVQLSKMVSVDIRDHLNRWHYGKVISVLLKVTSLFKRQDKIIETLCQDCTACGSELKTFVTRKEQGMPDVWTIVRCNTCNEFNLLSKGPDIKEYRFENYTSIEELPRNKYTEEQASVRLEQIKFFRKN